MGGAVATLMVLDRGDGKNYFGLPAPFKPRRPQPSGLKWGLLESRDGWWTLVSEHSYKPKPQPGQRRVRFR